MGVLNVTPDSFSDGGLFADVETAVAHAHQMAADGAHILDIGGESTRPATFRDQAPLSPAEEKRRILPVIHRLAAELPHIALSVDTYKAEVAQAALDAGAAILNDISGLTYDPAMGALAASRAVPVILMHLPGRPRDLPAHPVYADVVADILAFFTQQNRLRPVAGRPARTDLARPRPRLRQEHAAQSGNPATPARTQIFGLASRRRRIAQAFLSAKFSARTTRRTAKKAQPPLSPLALPGAQTSFASMTCAKWPASQKSAMRLCGRGAYDAVNLPERPGLPGDAFSDSLPQPCRRGDGSGF